VAKLVFYPAGINVLHLLVYLRQPESIQEAFAAGAKFLSSSIGTPISVCLQSKLNVLELKDCLDALLDRLTELSNTNPADFRIALHCLGDDFPRLLNSHSSNLPFFLETILVPLPPEFRYTQELCINGKLPLPGLWPDLKLDTSRVPKHKYRFWLETTSFPEYCVCPIPLKLDALLCALEKIKVSEGVLSKKAIVFIAKVKWRNTKRPLLVLAVLHWGLLVLIVCKVYDYGSTGAEIGMLVLLNLVLLGVSIWQAYTVGIMNFKSDVRTVIDIVRAVLTFVWAVTPKYQWFTLVTVALNSFVGLSTFKVFNETRVLVQMIFKVCTHTFYFVLLFLYSNLSFGVLLSVTDEEANLSFFESWKVAFELSMGGFDNSGVSALRWFVFFAACVVNVIWLLNLIVALLGTYYERFRTEVKSEDVKVQFELIYQFLSMQKPLPKWLKRRMSVAQPSAIRYLSVFAKKSEVGNPRKEPVTVHIVEKTEAALLDRMQALERTVEEKVEGVIDFLRTFNPQSAQAFSLHLRH